MIKKKINFSLSKAGIDDAIKELEKFEKYLVKKTNILKTKVAEFIREHASLGFMGSVSDDILTGAKYADVDVVIEEDGNVLIVIAKGEDAVWVEFGSGVYHNGPAGSCPNPLGEKFGFSIGGFGEKGRRKAWVFKDEETGERIFTHGTPANMPMYKAILACEDDLKSIVRQVFVDD